MSRVSEEKAATPIDPKMDRAIRFAAYQQLPIWLLTLLMLDFGQMNRACTVAIISQWLLITLITYRRPQNPTRCDLLAVRFGFIPIFVITTFAQHWRTDFAIAHPYANF
ncbi:hypothetical protein Mal52_38090 [Symmachiella dynata]|uniref:Uncharacterized protein n=2 Tax=Symmachiella dynata TaxID=2527995 RepID=A0A517ZS42_9PLAN|nr:hypothetical protein Mal52_38090 [Symmachiella dynata]